MDPETRRRARSAIARRRRGLDRVFDLHIYRGGIGLAVLFEDAQLHRAEASAIRAWERSTGLAASLTGW